MDTTKIHHVSKNDIHSWNDKATLEDIGEYLSSEAGAITTNMISDGAITGGKIANLAVGASQLENLSVTNAKIANTTISGSKLVNATITQTQLANSSVGTNQINNLAVTGAKIANSTITADKLATSLNLGGIRSVQRGYTAVSVANGGSLNITISSVNINKAFVVIASFYARQGAMEQGAIVYVRLINSTQIRFTAWGVQNTVNVEWQLVEFN